MAITLTACQGGKTAAGMEEGGDTLQMKYAQLLTIVSHDEQGYTEVKVHNPWKEGTELHRYIRHRAHTAGEQPRIHRPSLPAPHRAGLPECHHGRVRQGLYQYP